MTKSVMVCAALAVVFATSGALAQEEATDEAAVETTAEDTTSTAAADEGDGDATTAEKALEEDLALFWGKRRSIRVIQKRMFEKDGRLELTPFFGTIPNDDFIVYYPMGVRAGYHFSEAFSIEASYAYTIDNESELTTFLQDQIGLKRAELQEIIKMYYNLSLLWAPVYGKISVLGLKLTHFELYTGLGIGNFHTTEYPVNNPDGNPVQDKISANVVVGFRWFITENFNVRTDYRQLFFQKFDGEGNGGLSRPVELTLGVGVLL